MCYKCKNCGKEFDNGDEMYSTQKVIMNAGELTTIGVFEYSLICLDCNNQLVLKDKIIDIVNGNCESNKSRELIVDKIREVN